MSGEADIASSAVQDMKNTNGGRYPAGAPIVAWYAELCKMSESKVTMEQLHAAITFLPDKQAKRVCAHYFLDMSKMAIAKADCVNNSQVTRFIKKVLKSMKIFYKIALIELYPMV